MGTLNKYRAPNMVVITAPDRDLLEFEQIEYRAMGFEVSEIYPIDTLDGEQLAIQVTMGSNIQ